MSGGWVVGPGGAGSLLEKYLLNDSHNYGSMLEQCIEDGLSFCSRLQLHFSYPLQACSWFKLY